MDCVQAVWGSLPLRHRRTVFTRDMISVSADSAPRKQGKEFTIMVRDEGWEKDGLTSLRDRGMAPKARDEAVSEKQQQPSKGSFIFPFGMRSAGKTPPASAPASTALQDVLSDEDMESAGYLVRGLEVGSKEGVCGGQDGESTFHVLQLRASSAEERLYWVEWLTAVINKDARKHI